MVVNDPRLLFYRAPSVQDYEVGNATNIVARCNIRISLSINFHDHGVSPHFSRRFGNFRRRHVTRTAPIRPEIYKHRNTRILRDFVKLFPRY